MPVTGQAGSDSSDPELFVSVIAAVLGVRFEEIHISLYVWDLMFVR
jgi:hypothetical protein